MSPYLWRTGFAPGRLAVEFKILDPGSITKDDLKDCIYNKHNAVKSLCANEHYETTSSLIFCTDPALPPC